MAPVRVPVVTILDRIDGMDLADARVVLIGWMMRRLPPKDYVAAMKAETAMLAAHKSKLDERLARLQAATDE